MSDEKTILGYLIDINGKVSEQTNELKNLKTEYLRGRSANIENMRVINTAIKDRVRKDEIPWTLRCESVARNWKVVALILLVLTSIGVITINQGWIPFIGR